MKLIKPSYEILTPIDGKTILKDIEKAARTCYKSEDKINDESAEKLITRLIKRGHEAMLEFGPSITVKWICDRGVSHEIVRHRIASFAQESTRYVNYTKDKYDGDITFILPNWMPEHYMIDSLKNGDIWETVLDHDLGDNFLVEHRIWLQQMIFAEETYNFLIKKGWSPQQARSVLPNSLKTEINVKANIREWRHIFKLRANKAAHPQMREIAQPLLDEFKSKIPILFDDINY